MEIYRAVLADILARDGVTVEFKGLDHALADSLVESVCRKAIQEIRCILDNSTLDDFECVERIVLVLESIGTDGGSRHDF